MRSALLSLTAALAMAVTAPVAAADGTAPVVVNGLTVPVAGLYLSELDIQRWGVEMLAANEAAKPLPPGARAVLTTVTQGLFDVRLVDSAGRACVVREVDLSRAATWTIRASDVAGCQGFGEP
jgi:hypothetical protein